MKIILHFWAVIILQLCLFSMTNASELKTSLASIQLDDSWKIKNDSKNEINQQNKKDPYIIRNNEKTYKLTCSESAEATEGNRMTIQIITYDKPDDFESAFIVDRLYEMNVNINGIIAAIFSSNLPNGSIKEFKPAKCELMNEGKFAGCWLTVISDPNSKNSTHILFAPRNNKIIMFLFTVNKSKSIESINIIWEHILDKLQISDI